MQILFVTPHPVGLPKREWEQGLNRGGVDQLDSTFSIKKYI